MTGMLNHTVMLMFHGDLQHFGNVP